LQFYKKPLEEELKALQAAGREVTKLDDHEIKMVFSRVEPILRAHVNIRRELRTLLDNWSPDALVGRIWAHE
jgi:hypothetical protein